jgi:hypothetical protein
VTYVFAVTVEVPTDVADDRQVSADYLAEHEDLRLDRLPSKGNGGSSVMNELVVSEIKYLHGVERASFS